MGLPANRPAPAEDAPSVSPKKKKAGLLSEDRSSPSAVSDKGKALPLSGSKRKAADGESKGKASEPKGKSSGSKDRSSGSKGNSLPSSKADAEAISFKLNAQAQARQQAASAARTAFAVASASLSFSPAKTAAVSLSPVGADSSRQPAVADSARQPTDVDSAGHPAVPDSSQHAARESRKTSGDLPAGRDSPTLANPKTAAGPSPANTATSQAASVVASVPSGMPEGSTYNTVPTADAHAHPLAQLDDAAGLTPAQPLITPHTDAAAETTPHFLRVPKAGARPGALPDRFRFGMSEPAGIPRSDLADADLPPLPVSATAEEEAAQRQESECPPLPPPLLPEPTTDSSDAAQQQAAPEPALQLPAQQPMKQPDQRSSRHSSSSRSSRWGPEAQPNSDPHPTPTGSGQNATSEARSGRSHHDPSAAQLPEQLPSSIMHSSSSCWGLPSGSAQIPSRPGVPTDPRIKRKSWGSPQTTLPLPPPWGSSGSAPTRYQGNPTTSLAQPSAPVANPSPMPSWARNSQHRPGVTSPHDFSSRQLICPKNPTPSAQTSAQTHPDASAWPQSHSSASVAAGSSEQSEHDHQQQRSQKHDSSTASWYTANPDACGTCRTSSVDLSYQWGHNAAVKGDLQLTARIWSTERMGRHIADSGEINQPMKFSQWWGAVSHQTSWPESTSECSSDKKH